MATGSVPAPINISGLDRGFVTTAQDVLEGKVSVGREGGSDRRWDDRLRDSQSSGASRQEADDHRDALRAGRRRTDSHKAIPLPVAQGKRGGYLLQFHGDGDQGRRLDRDRPGWRAEDPGSLRQRGPGGRYATGQRPGGRASRDRRQHSVGGRCELGQDGARGSRRGVRGRTRRYSPQHQLVRVNRPFRVASSAARSSPPPAPVWPARAGRTWSPSSR